MCDTILAMPSQTRNGVTLFGKNSDRQRNEAQAVERIEAANHPEGAELSCTYISIPEARRTNAVLLCRPHWGWGAEMGGNEWGVVIGNEAVHARTIAPSETPALTGMDLLRLALERAATAREAVDTITSLLSIHGQGGDCGHVAPSYYHNSFLVADSQDGFVVETVGREWLVEKVTTARAISNRYSIGTNVEAVSDGLSALVHPSNLPEGYAGALRDPEREHIGHACVRQERAQGLLTDRAGEIDVRAFMAILRDHGSQPGWLPRTSEVRTICMHAQGHDRNGQTAGSLVSEIAAAGVVHWVTATSAPCLSIYKPVLLDVPLPYHGPSPGDICDEASLWWRHERMHRSALASDDLAAWDAIAVERDGLEVLFQQRMAQLPADDLEARSRAVAQCWTEALEAELRWGSAIEGQSQFDKSPFGLAWAKANRLAGVR